MKRSTKELNSRKLNSLGRILTNLLRHDARKHGLKVLPDGYILVADILQLKNLTTRSGIPLNQHAFLDVIEAVKQDGKQRMSLRGEGVHMEIRANQGHSMEGISVEALCEKISSPDDLPVAGLAVHGTYRNVIDRIKSEGLKTMGRNGVHFATQEMGSDSMISGMRKSAQVLIYLDVVKALEEGLPLYLSSNKVLLCPQTVPPRFFKRIRYIS